MVFVSPSHPQIEYSDYAWVEFSDEAARFTRRITSASGFHFDNPGARIRLCSDATRIRVHLFYDGLHSRLDSLNGWGIYLRDGKTHGRYGTQERGVEYSFEIQTVGDGLQHLYEIVMPYGDSVEFRGIDLNTGASMTKVPARPTTRWVAYGDSITQGFTASDVSQTYPFHVGEQRQWQVINMGFGSRQATPEDGIVIGLLNPSLITIAIGVNDCLHAKPLSAFQKDVQQLIGNIAEHLKPSVSKVPVCVLTPLPIPGDGWGDAEHRLGDYRRVLRHVVEDDASITEHNFQLQLIEGNDLIPASTEFFQDGLHPNDRGFQFIAEHLVAKIRANCFNA